MLDYFLQLRTEKQKKHQGHTSLQDCCVANFKQNTLLELN